MGRDFGLEVGKHATRGLEQTEVEERFRRLQWVGKVFSVVEDPGSLGRSMKSSGRISRQKSFTARDLEQNR